MESKAAPKRHVAMDTATLYGLLHALTYEKPEDWPAWTARAAYAATLLPLSCQWIQLPPSPRKPNYSLMSGVLIKNLNGFLGKTRREESDITAMADQLNDQIINSVNDTRTRIDAVASDPSYEPWIDRAVSHFWPELRVLQTGLFDLEFIPALAILLDVQDRELMRVREQSLDEARVNAWAAGTERGDDYELCKRAYFANNLLRGAFYDAVTQAFYNGEKLTLHPMRSSFLAVGDDWKLVHVQENRTLTAMAALIIGSALSEKDRITRVEKWCQNVQLLRAAIIGGDVQVEDIDNEDARLSRLQGIVRQVGLMLTTEEQQRALRVGNALTVGGASLMLALWTGLTVGAGALVSLLAATLAGSRVPERASEILEKHQSRETRIEKLHELGGGRFIYMN